MGGAGAVSAREKALSMGGEGAVSACVARHRRQIHGLRTILVRRGRVSARWLMLKVGGDVVVA